MNATFIHFFMLLQKQGVHSDGRNEVEYKDKISKTSSSATEKLSMEIIILSKNLLPEFT
jgi:hypothetical protein